MAEILIFLSGAAFGAVFAYLWLNKIKIEKSQAEKERDRLREENERHRQKEIEWAKQSSLLESQKEQNAERLESQKQAYEDKLADQEKQFEQRREADKILYEEKEARFRDFVKEAKALLESATQKNLIDSAKNYREASAKDLSQILEPFKKDIDGFKKSIQGFESKEKFLDDAINSFKDINSKMRDEAKRLAQTLRGDIKAQGQWGEFVLANILEKSGLRKGEEFITNKEKTDIKGEEGGSIKPDVIVKLPDNKQIIIDSKVSLTAYEEHLSSETEERKNESLTKILNSVSAHIDNLSSKKYPLAEGLRSPDFTLMFIPNEGVFSLLTQTKKDLFEKAWRQSIVLVSPATLYAALRTIASIWKIERQNKNAENIAKQGRLLYDRFVGFLENMSAIDNSLTKARASYDLAFGALKGGSRSLIQTAQRLERLGAGNKKKIPSEFSAD